MSITSDAWMTHRELQQREAAQREFPDPDVKLCAGRMRWEDQSGPVWIATCDKCGFDMGVPRRAVDPGAEVARRMHTANLPQMFIDKLFEPTPGTADARRMLRVWVEQFVADRPPTPCLIGPPGRGKTHLAVQAAVALVRRHLTPLLFIGAGELIEAMRESYRGSSIMRSELVDRAATTGVLLLDDVATPPTEYIAERLYQLIDARYRMGRPLLVTTNVPVERWPESFGPRSASRLAGMTAPVRVFGPDMRQAIDAGEQTAMGVAHGQV